MTEKRAEPQTLCRGILKTMEHERLALVMTTWVPDRYRIQMTSEDWDHLSPIAEEVRSQIIDMMVERISKKDYRMLADELVVEMGPGDVPPDKPFFIEAFYSEEDRPAAATERPSAAAAVSPVIEEPAIEASPVEEPVQETLPLTGAPPVKESPTPKDESAALDKEDDAELDKPITVKTDAVTPPAETEDPLVTAELHPPESKEPRIPPRSVDEPLVTGEIFSPGEKPLAEEDDLFAESKDKADEKLPLVESQIGNIFEDEDTTKEEPDSFMTGALQIPGGMIPKPKHTESKTDADDFQFDTLDEDESGVKPAVQEDATDEQLSAEDLIPDTSESEPEVLKPSETMLNARLHDAPTMQMSSDELHKLMAEDAKAGGGPYFDEFVKGEPGRKIPIAGMELIIGRGEVDIISPVIDGLISRRHAVLSQDGSGQWKIKDISTNGLKLNGKQTKESLLSDGDTIEMGTWKLEYHDSNLQSGSGI